MRLLTALLAAIAIAALTGCMGPEARVDNDRQALANWLTEAPAEAPMPVDTAPPAVLLGPGDLIEIELLGITDSREEVAILVDGSLHYGPLAGVPAAGTSVTELTERLEAELTAWYRRPRVVVNVREWRSRTATVLGRVNKPGMVALSGGERIRDLVAATGGLAASRFSGTTEELADLTGAFYVRDGERLPIDFEALLRHGDERYNLQVHPGDYCYIPSSMSREVYVLGAVSDPNAVGFRDGLGLAEALAGAGGPSEDAYLRRCLVVRQRDGQPLAARVDVEAILLGHLPDVVLQPRDVIYLPGRTADNPELIWEQATRAFAGGAAGVIGNRVYNGLRE